MQVRIYDKKDNLVFAYVLQAGSDGKAEYDAVYDEKNKVLHIYDDLTHHDTSIINNRNIKSDVLELLGYSDGFMRSIVNKITNKPMNHDTRMIVYIADLIWEITNDRDPFQKVEDESLLYKPFCDRGRRIQQSALSMLKKNMPKEYSEQQYQIYCEHMDRLANEPVISENATIYVELKQWIEESNLSPLAVEQMDERMLQEVDEMMAKKQL